MILEYDILVEDLVAFNRHHIKVSPTMRRQVRAFQLVGAALALVMALAMGHFVIGSLLLALPFGVGGAVAVALLHPILIDRSIKRTAHKLVSEGENKGLVGHHALVIEPDGLRERTAVNEDKRLWDGVERVDRAEEHAYIYIGAMLAHVIPRERVKRGDLDAFLDEVERNIERARGAA